VQVGLPWGRRYRINGPASRTSAIAQFRIKQGGQDTWEGEFRCVTFVSADVDAAMQEDPLLPEVGWNWLLSSLEEFGCSYNAPSGTVTRVSSASFGKLSPRNNESEIEIRASWTPVISSGDDVAQVLLNHVMAWCNLIAEISFLPPIADGVASISKPRK
jgi:hypothetical protein